MQSTKSIQGVAGAILMAVTVLGHVQAGTEDAGSAVPASASSASKKAVGAENRRLQKDVLRNLSNTKGLNTSNIVVVARSGVVTLGGSVPEASQIELAVAAARGVGGVAEVKSNLVVRPEGL